MKKNIIIIICVIIVMCFGVFFLIRNKKSDQEIVNNAVPKTFEIDNVIEKSFYSGDIKLNDLEKILGNDIVSNLVLFGKDSILRQIVSDSIISKYNLFAYTGIQSSLADNVETAYIENTSYSSEEDSNGNVDFKIKPWYFSAYSNDLSLLIEKIFSLAGLSLEPDKMSKEKHDACYYEAKILAMKILDSHLSDYKNKDEEIDFIFYYQGDKAKKNQYFSLYLNLIGATCNGVDNDSSRLDNYLNEALDTGIINRENPLVSNI